MLLSEFFNKIIEDLYFKQEGNLALYDRLTGVYNYNWFNMFGHKLYIEKSVYVTVIDINGFKQINDTHGHLHGNNILKQVATQLSYLKNYDNSVAVVRYGGDEFVIISDSDPLPLIETCIEEPDLISYGIVKKQAFEPLSIAFVKADEKMYSYKQEFKKKNQKRA